MSDVHGEPIEWLGNGLIVTIWLSGYQKSGLFRLLLNSGSTHIALPEQWISYLELERAEHGRLFVPGSGHQSITSLYRLPRTELAVFRRDDLLVALIDLPLNQGYHGLLGMNWLRTFAHVGLIGLQTDRPILELHGLTSSEVEM